MLSVDPKGTISEVRVHAGLYLDILDADQWSNAVRFHVGTTQVEFKVDRRHLQILYQEIVFITMVKEKVILYKKKSFEK